MQRIKFHGVKKEEWDIIQEDVTLALARSLRQMTDLTFPSGNIDHFVMDTDWSGIFSAYLLFAFSQGQGRLVDMGSHVHNQPTSSHLGELGAIVWACKATKPYRGELPMTIRTDHQTLAERWTTQEIISDDVRIFRRWGWLLANEPNLKMEFLPGV